MVAMLQKTGIEELRIVCYETFSQRNAYAVTSERTWVNAYCKLKGND